ncbi:MAG: serine/threonine protein kinase [Deltaproteobacteria bacterium]|nr:serine/threonine protein kinase [Deltaproteobacteria bacterium]
MTTGPGDSEVDLDEPVEREGHETLLPSVTRSVLSAKSFVASEAGVDSMESAAAVVADEDSWDGKTRGARGGDVIGGRYIVEGQLGRGGMGRVLRVRHQALGKAFALKLIKTRIATNPKIREMFYREARLASALTHDNICSIVDFGQDENHGLFMVMELLDGQNLRQKLKQSGKLSPKVACDVMWQVADAVRFIHSRTIVHGDIKTENIFLVKTTMNRRLVKLLDFGLARPDLGRTEGMDGTPEYIAPERIDHAPTSQASDIYALGIVFFELLTSRVPFTGEVEEVLRQHREVVVPKPSTMIEEPLDDRADELIARATAKDPTKRHPDVAAFMYELRALMNMLGVDHGGRARRAMAPEAVRERRDLDHRLKAAAEVFGAVAIPMGCCDASGKVRVANQAFLEFLGVAGNAGGLELRDSALPEVYPTLFEDLHEVSTTRRPIKRVIYLNEGGDRVVEAAIVLSAAPSGAEVTAGEVHLVLHPLRALLS